MACVERMIKAGINRSSPIPYRSFCSGDNVARPFNLNTFVVVKGLKEQGISSKHAKAISSSMAEFLAELEKLEKNPSHPSTSLKTKFEALKKSIKKVRHIVDEFTLESRRHGQRIDQEIEALRREVRTVRSGLGICFGMLIGIMTVGLCYNSEQQTA